MSIRARAEASCRTSRTSSPGADRSCMTIQSIVLTAFSAESRACISAATNGPTCCCPSFRRKNRSLRVSSLAGLMSVLEQSAREESTTPSKGRNTMRMNRRDVITGALAAGAAAQVLKVPAAPAQAAPVRVGFLTIKTGPLASGGLQMEQGLTVFFKERNNMLAGRPGELPPPDTAANRAQAPPKLRSWWNG